MSKRSLYDDAQNFGDVSLPDQSDSTGRTKRTRNSDTTDPDQYSLAESPKEQATASIGTFSASPSAEEGKGYASEGDFVVRSDDSGKIPYGSVEIDEQTTKQPPPVSPDTRDHNRHWQSKHKKKHDAAVRAAKINQALEADRHRIHESPEPWPKTISDAQSQEPSISEAPSTTKRKQVSWDDLDEGKSLSTGSTDDIRQGDSAT